MNTEIKAMNRFEEAGFDGKQSKSMVAGIDDLLVKSMAAFREYFDHRFEAIDHRFEAIDHRIHTLENSSLLADCLFSVGSAVLCSSVVDNISSYCPGFISLSGQELVTD